MSWLSWHGHCPAGPQQGVGKGGCKLLINFVLGNGRFLSILPPMRTRCSLLEWCAGIHSRAEPFSNIVFANLNIKNRVENVENASRQLSWQSV